MRILLLALAGLMALTVLVTPAAAGTTDDPDVTDPCDEAHVMTEPITGTPISHVAPWLDIDSGWVSMADDGSAVTVGLRTCGAFPADNPQNAVEGQLRVHWSHGDCNQTVVLWDHEADGVQLNGNGPSYRAQLWQSGCGEDLRLDLEPGQAVRGGDTVTWTLPTTGDLAVITGPLVPAPNERVVLTKLRAVTQYHVGLQGYLQGDDTDYGRAVIFQG